MRCEHPFQRLWIHVKAEVLWHFLLVPEIIQGHSGKDGLNLQFQAKVDAFDLYAVGLVGQGHLWVGPAFYHVLLILWWVQHEQRLLFGLERGYLVRYLEASGSFFAYFLVPPTLLSNIFFFCTDLITGFIFPFDCTAFHPMPFPIIFFLHYSISFIPWISLSLILVPSLSCSHALFGDH